MEMCFIMLGIAQKDLKMQQIFEFLFKKILIGASERLDLRCLRYDGFLLCILLDVNVRAQ